MSTQLQMWRDGHTPYKHLHSHHYLVICQQVVQEGGGILVVGTHSDTQYLNTCTEVATSVDAYQCLAQN